MDPWLFTVIYTVLPCLVALFAAAVFLTRRSIGPGKAWLIGLMIATLLTFGATIAMRGALRGMVPTSELVKAYAALYFIPLIVLTGAATELRRRLSSRLFGVIVLLALLLATSVITRHASGYFFDLVNASG